MTASKSWKHNLAGKICLFLSDYALETVPEANCCGATMIESQFSKSVEQKVRKFPVIGQDYWVMPFLKYGLWKHNVAKAANLWVKLQQRSAEIKMPHGWLRGATNREAGQIIHDYWNNARHENMVVRVFQLRYDL
jgi:hypothetical protein